MDVVAVVSAVAAVIATGVAIWQAFLARRSARDADSHAERALAAENRSANAAEDAARAATRAADAHEATAEAARTSAEVASRRAAAETWTVHRRGRGVYSVTKVGANDAFDVHLVTNTYHSADEHWEHLSAGASREFLSMVSGGDDKPEVRIEWSDSPQSSSPRRTWASALPR